MLKDSFKPQTKSLKLKMNREWESLKQQQEAFDFSVFEIVDKDGDDPDFSMRWVEPGLSWEFDPCPEEHYCGYIGEAISVAKSYIDEFPNRKTGNWSFINPTEKPCRNVEKAFDAYALDYHLHNGEWPTEFKCNGKVYGEDWCWVRSMFIEFDEVGKEQ